MKPKCRLFDFAEPEPEAKDYQRCLHVFFIYGRDPNILMNPSCNPYCLAYYHIF